LHGSAAAITVLAAARWTRGWVLGVLARLVMAQAAPPVNPMASAAMKRSVRVHIVVVVLVIADLHFGYERRIRCTGSSSANANG
jgi:hypothetical protein